MKKNFLYILIFAFLLQGCASWKHAMVATGNENAAVRNAILDFLHTNNIKKDSVFSVSVKNINEDILGVSILTERNKISVVTKNEIDYNYSAFPTQYFEQNGKLFYWRDSTEKVPIDLINKLTKINRIDTAIIDKYFPERIRDDSQKGDDNIFVSPI